MSVQVRRRPWRRPALAVLLAATSCSGTSDRTGAEPGTDLTVYRDTQRVRVHLPAGYRTTGTSRRYPVLILIHGAGADSSQWLDIGATTTADRLTSAGGIGAAIVVMPDFGNASSDTEAAAVTDDLVPWVDEHFRTLPDAAHRAVGGISRGGGAALLAAATRPDLFGIVGGHSPAIATDDGRLADGLSTLGGNIRLDVGASDGLRPSVSRFADRLAAAGVAAEFHVAPGRHDRSYWRSQMNAYLSFYAARWR